MTTPPTGYTAELESMIAIMSGDFQSARRWIRQIPREDRLKWTYQLNQLVNLTHQTLTDGD